MVTNVKTLGVRRRRLLLASLMLVVLFAFMSVFVLAMDATDVVHVSSEAELVNAVNNASKPTIIILDNDITLLDNPLVISDEKDITLMSKGNWKFFKLIGANDIPDQPTISVDSGGVLRLKGITITHIEGVSGTGVRVNFDGTLIMLGGVISDNIDGGGVSNSGTFQMLGGTISNNRAQNGGGVYNNGNFSLLGGKISNNKVSGGGGGVSNSGIFQMFGGTILNNYASTWNVGGGGVSNDGNFSMSGGKITCNTAGYEGRHYHSGVPSGYHYIGRGGGVYNIGTFSLSGGVIFGNTAVPDRSFSNPIVSKEAVRGNGVYNTGTFNRTGGVIFGNLDYGINVVIICVGAVALVISVVLVVYYFLFPKKNKKQPKPQISVVS